MSAFEFFFLSYACFFFAFYSNFYGTEMCLRFSLPLGRSRRCCLVVFLWFCFVERFFDVFFLSFPYDAHSNSTLNTSWCAVYLLTLFICLAEIMSRKCYDESCSCTYAMDFVGWADIFHMPFRKLLVFVSHFFVLFVLFPNLFFPCIHCSCFILFHITQFSSHGYDSYFLYLWMLCCASQSNCVFILPLFLWFSVSSFVIIGLQTLPMCLNGMCSQLDLLVTLFSWCSNGWICACFLCPYMFVEILIFDGLFFSTPIFSRPSFD